MIIPSRRAALVTLGAAVLSACLSPITLSPEGFACEVDGDCDDPGAYACVDAHCISREALTETLTPFPVRAAFVTGSFPHNWTLGTPHQTPRAGFYSSNDADLQREQIASMEAAHFDAAFFHWYGATTATDRVFSQLLTQPTQGLKWAVVAEEELTREPTARDVQLLIADIHTRFGSSSNYLRVEGGLLVVVPTNYYAECEAVERWVKGVEASKTETFLLMRVSSLMPEDGRGCEFQPSAWYRTSGNQSRLETGDAITLMPGAWPHDAETPKLERDPDRFRQDVESLASASARFHLFQSFNDWNAGTQLEPSEDDPEALGPWLGILQAAP